MRREPFDKKKLLREQDHLTRPPRLEGVVKNAMMNVIRKRKKKRASGASSRGRGSGISL
ncbi:MAG TPA: hypothetical protein VMV50_00870 [Candidatus Paceibacterota bacterium]|nr:hypothetical protein [Candidatus Paceibacterota bacterium]